MSSKPLCTGVGGRIFKSPSSDLIGKIVEFLSSKEGGQETADEEMAFIEKSIGAVPTYFINDKYIIQGGQEPETFISFLDKIILKEKENADSR